MADDKNETRDPSAMPEPTPRNNGQVETDGKDLQGRVPVGLKQGDPQDDGHDTIGAVGKVEPAEVQVAKGKVEVIDGSSTVTAAQADKLREKLG